MARNRMTMVAVGVAASLVWFAGCGGDDSGSSGQTTGADATTTTSTQTQTATAAPAELTAAVDAFVAALRDRDRTRLRDGTGDQLRQRLRDRELDRLGTCVPAGAQIEVISRDVTVEGDEARVRVRLRLTDATGATREVEREWEFQRRADGTWGLKELPDCPFAATTTTTDEDSDTTTQGTTTEQESETETETETSP